MTEAQREWYRKNREKNIKQVKARNKYITDELKKRKGRPWYLYARGGKKKFKTKEAEEIYRLYKEGERGQKWWSEKMKQLRIKKGGKCIAYKAALLRGIKVETWEHKWATKAQARKIALDHIQREGLRAYPKRRK